MIRSLIVGVHFIQLIIQPYAAHSSILYIYVCYYYDYEWCRSDTARYLQKEEDEEEREAIKYKWY